MKMATATDNRQYISIIDNDKISKSKAMQNLNNNNPVSSGSWTVAPNGRRSRNDSINNPGWLHNSLTDEFPTGLDCILNDCMWNISDEGFCKSEHNEFDALFGSFNSDSDPVNSNSTSTFSVSCGVQRRETGPDVAESSAAHLAASGSLPPSPSSTCTSGESESASYALSILDDLEPLSVEDVDRFFTESLDVAQLHRIFTSPRRSSDSALWNDEITVPIGNSEQRPIDVRPKAAVAPPVRRQMAAAAVRPRSDFGTLKNMLTPQRALKRPPTGNEDYAAASKMRRTVAASAARLGCAMSGGAIDCEVVIREDEHEAIEQVEVEYEVSGDVETDYEHVPLPARVSVTPRLLPIRGAPGRVQPRVAPGSMQPLRGGVAKLQRTASGNLVGVNSRLTYGNPAFAAQRAASYNPQTISRPSAFAGAPFNRQTFGPGRMPMGLSQGQDSPYGIAGGRLPGRPPKRMSLPSAVSGSSTQSDGESSVSMNAPRRGSSSYCSQMERNRRREMNTALAALRRLILEDDRSLLSKVYAKSQLNRRNTSMIMTLRAAHDTVLKLNDNARRALEERNEQARRRERLLKRLQQLQATQQPQSQSQQTHVQPAAHMTLLSAKSDWSV